MISADEKRIFVDIFSGDEGSEPCPNCYHKSIYKLS